jgi:hypothetical protein
MIGCSDGLLTSAPEVIPERESKLTPTGQRETAVMMRNATKREAVKKTGGINHNDGETCLSSKFGEVGSRNAQTRHGG